jgi:hypothetical protein
VERLLVSLVQRARLDIHFDGFPRRLARQTLDGIEILVDALGDRDTAPIDEFEVVPGSLLPLPSDILEEDE